MRFKRNFVFLLIFTSIIFSGCSSKIDYSCETAEDCEIKDLGNDCGYQPRCVNVDFEPVPPMIKGNECGYRSISACKCEKNVCIGYFED